MRFNVKNFLTFDERDNGRSEEFSMIAGKVRSKKDHVYSDGKTKLLKFASVYGANASGKSSLVKAISFMQQAVTKCLPNGYSEMYCKTDLNNSNKPTYFETEIMIDGKYYSYGFEILLKQGKFLSEWLIALTSNYEEEIFVRDIPKKNIRFGKIFKAEQLEERMKIYAEDVKEDDNMLFLNTMNHSKKSLYIDFPDARIFRDIYLWFKETLTIIFPSDVATDYVSAFQTNKVKDVMRFLDAFGTGITGYKLVDVELEKILRDMPANLRNALTEVVEDAKVKLNRGILKSAHYFLRSENEMFIWALEGRKSEICKKIQFIHNNADITFGLREESDGTIRLLDLLEILLDNQKKVYVLDELDRCLHPILSRKFVQTYLDLSKNRDTQLIVTTHESRLIDLKLLRRDEIWFVEKNLKGQANIYSLEEYNTRFDKKVDKAYLEGRYGGVPVFGQILPVEEA